MLERLLMLKKEIQAYAFTNGGYKRTKSKNKVEPLEEDEWKALTDLATLLKPFKVAMEQLEGNKYVTASLVPAVIFQVHHNLELADK